MERIKQLFSEYFEVIVVFILVAAVALTILVVVNKVAFLNFFYVPILFGSYYLGKRKGILVSVLAVLLIVFYAVLNPFLFGGEQVDLPIWNITLWASFLILTAYLVGNLYEKKESTSIDLKKAYEGVLEILLKFIDVVDRYTEEHSVRVSKLAAQVGEAYGLTNSEIEDIRVAGLLHDIGKCEISVDVLRKASSLNEEEWEEMKKHATVSPSVIKPVGGLLQSVVPLIMTHHEFFNGGGYHGLKYEDIPVGSRILAVVDAFDSMISDRPYRKGRQPWEAIKEIENNSGSQFDPGVVKVFVGVVKEVAQRS